MKIKSKNKHKVLFFLIILSAFIYQSVGCIDLSEGCANEVIKEILSPNKNYKAVIFQRDCGSTTNYSTQISILEANEALSNKKGNIFVCDDDHGRAPSDANGKILILVEWKTNDSIYITYDSRTRIFSSRTYLSGISITYNKQTF